MKKLPKSLGLLCSASMLVLWGNVAHAASPDLGHIHDNTVSNLVTNSPDDSLGKAIDPVDKSLNPEITAPIATSSSTLITTSLEVSSSLPELQSPTTIQPAVNTSEMELPELRITTSTPDTTIAQTPVAPNLTALNIANPPINLSEVSTSAGDITPLQPSSTILSQRVGDRVSPFTPTAYIGIGVNLGLGSSNSVLSSGRFLVYGKFGFTENISLRPAILLGNDTTVLIPVTYDFPLQAADAIQPVSFVPYVGGGAIIATGSGNNNLGFLLTGGVDFPISRDFTATAALNVGFIRSTTDFGILLGVAYNIPGLRF